MDLMDQDLVDHMGLMDQDLKDHMDLMDQDLVDHMDLLDLSLEGIDLEANQREENHIMKKHSQALQIDLL